MIGYCPMCDEDQPLRREIRREVYRVRGESIEVDAEVLVCERCGGDVADRECDERTLRLAYDTYRERHGLLRPEDIRNLRTRYGLSQRALARLLGWGLVTIQRYENGALQDVAHDAVLRQLTHPRNVLALVERAGSRLSERERLAIRRAVLSQTEATDAEHLVDDIEVSFNLDFERRPLVHGARPVDLDRVGNIAAWFAVQCSDLFKTKLAKLLWIADFLHFRRHRVSITGLTYVRLPHGPVPDRYSLLLGALEQIEAIELREQAAGQFVGEVVRALAEPDLSDLTTSERDTLEAVVRRFGGRSSNGLSELAHREEAWRGRQDGEPIPYSEADHLDLLNGIPL